MSARTAYRQVDTPLHYKHPDSPMTLREGLVEYAATSPELLEAGGQDSAAGALDAHDAAHVVFGCDTSVRGEILLTRWSFMGATDWIPFYLKGLRYPSTRGLVLEFFAKARPWTLAAAVLEGFRCIGRSLRMRARWPSEEWRRHLDRPLAEIRREFNIRVV